MTQLHERNTNVNPTAAILIVLILIALTNVVLLVLAAAILSSMRSHDEEDDGPLGVTRPRELAPDGPQGPAHAGDPETTGIIDDFVMTAWSPDKEEEGADTLLAYYAAELEDQPFFAELLAELGHMTEAREPRDSCPSCGSTDPDLAWSVEIGDYVPTADYMVSELCCIDQWHRQETDTTKTEPAELEMAEVSS